MLGPDSLPGGPMAFPANASVPFLPNVITFGPQANCTLHICPVEWSVYKYRPSVPANAVFLALFSAALLVHVAIGWRWRSWGFMGFMVAGCLLEVVGYAGRILLHANPWSFGAFMTQIVLITCGPVFYTAAIYVTLSNIIQHLGEHISRIKPQLFYYIFIPADIVCLVLQAAGGAISVVSSGASQNGIDIALAGLGLQVASLVIFSALLADYLVRYFRHRPLSTLDLRMRVFFGFLSAAVVLVLLRCVYRCYELSQGYIGSKLVTDEGLFIGLEGVPIVLAVFSLCLGHPGLVLRRDSSVPSSAVASDGTGTDSAEEWKTDKENAQGAQEGPSMP